MGLLDAKRIQDIYERHALEWDQHRSRDLCERVWLNRFLTLLPKGGAVLDMGSGSAEPLARFIIERGYGVAGIDTSPTLISLSRSRFPGQDWLVRDMRTLSLGRTFDGLLAWDSFFHLPQEDQRLMFRVFKEHSHQGSALMFTSGPSHGEGMGTFQGEPLYHASLGEPEYRSILNANGFEVVKHVTKDPACGHHTIWLAQQIGGTVPVPGEI